jgi:hypothetical protein
MFFLGNIFLGMYLNIRWRSIRKLNEVDFVFHYFNFKSMLTMGVFNVESNVLLALHVYFLTVEICILYYMYIYANTV